MTIDALIPVRTVSETNQREHWRTTARRRKMHRSLSCWSLRHRGRPPEAIREATVTLTRIAPRKLDGDNLLSSLKAIRDGVADWLGIDDGSERIRWEYVQRRGRPREYAVEIGVEIDGA